MNIAALCCFLVLYVTRVFSVTISSPTMERKSTGESCTFRWSVTGNFTTYSIKILSTGSPTTLGPNTNHTFDSSKGVISLLIWGIQTSDAGNYSLSISTGPSTKVNSIAVLFVFDTPYAYTILAVGRDPGFEGDRIELNCSASSYSLPAEHRTKMYYFWHSNWNGYFRNISSGPAMLKNGDVLPGYSIKNDGETFVIASSQSTDYGFSCTVQEEGSPYKSPNNNYFYVTIYSYTDPMTYTPYDTVTIPYGEKEHPLLIAVIVLAVLLGVTILGLISCLIAFLVYKSRQKLQSNSFQQQPPAGITRLSNANGQGNAAYDYEIDPNYEEVTNPSVDNDSYTQLHVFPQRTEEYLY